MQRGEAQQEPARAEPLSVSWRNYDAADGPKVVKSSRRALDCGWKGERSGRTVERGRKATLLLGDPGPIARTQPLRIIRVDPRARSRTQARTAGGGTRAAVESGLVNERWLDAHQRAIDHIKRGLIVFLERQGGRFAVAQSRRVKTGQGIGGVAESRPPTSFDLSEEIADAACVSHLVEWQEIGVGQARRERCPDACELRVVKKARIGESWKPNRVCRRRSGTRRYGPWKRISTIGTPTKLRKGV